MKILLCLINLAVHYFSSSVGSTCRALFRIRFTIIDGLPVASIRVCSLRPLLFWNAFGRSFLLYTQLLLLLGLISGRIVCIVDGGAITAAFVSSPESNRVLLLNANSCSIRLLHHHTREVRLFKFTAIISVRLLNFLFLFHENELKFIKFPLL